MINRKPFEIAGTVLGAIPLLIAAIEHYNDGHAPIKAFRL